MCRIFKVYHIGFYAWLKEPLNNKAKDDRRLMGSLKQAWLESGCVNGYHKLHDDLRSLGETCSPNKIARLTGLSVIKAHIGYKRNPGFSLFDSQFRSKYILPSYNKIVDIPKQEQTPSVNDALANHFSKITTSNYNAIIHRHQRTQTASAYSIFPLRLPTARRMAAS